MKVMNIKCYISGIK